MSHNSFCACVELVYICGYISIRFSAYVSSCIYSNHGVLKVAGRERERDGERVSESWIVRVEKKRTKWGKGNIGKGGNLREELLNQLFFCHVTFLYEMMVLVIENTNLSFDECLIESMSDECVYEFFAMMDEFGSSVAYMNKSDEL